MKGLKKRGFWVLFAVLILVGAFFFVDFGFQNRSVRIPNVNAQDLNLYNLGINTNSYGYSMIGLGSIYGHVYAALSHPTDLMPTMLTCSGCSATQSTCGWDCGPTFQNCGGSRGSSGSGGNIGTYYGGTITTGTVCTGPTGFICPIPTSLICPSPTGSACSIPTGAQCPTPTGMACNTGLVCTGGSCTGWWKNKPIEIPIGNTMWSAGCGGPGTYVTCGSSTSCGYCAFPIFDYLPSQYVGTYQWSTPASQPSAF